MLDDKKSPKGIALIYLILIIIAVLVIGIGAFFAVNYFNNSKADNQNATNNQEDQKTENKVESELDENGIAYKFSIDSKNKRVYDVTPFNSTDLYVCVK